MADDSPLDRIEKSFLDLGVALGCVSGMLQKLQRINRNYELDFSGPHGEIISFKKTRGDWQDLLVKRSGEEERDFMAEVNEARAHELREIGQFLPEYIELLLKSKCQAQAAVGALPRELEETLTSLKGKPWAALVRRTCLDHVCAWPSEQLETVGGPKILSDIPYMLDQAEQFDPHEKWADYCRLLEEYRADAAAVRGYDLLSKPAPEAGKTSSNKESINVTAGQAFLAAYKEANDGKLPPPMKIPDDLRKKLEALASHPMLKPWAFELPILDELTDDEILAESEDHENRSSVGDSGEMDKERVDSAETERAVGDGKPMADKESYSEPDNYDRDKWIYEERVNGRTWTEIRSELNDSKQWAPLYSDNGMRNAVKSYCTFHKIEIPKGRSGRPKHQ